MERLEADGKTAMLVAGDGALAGIIAVADTLKPEAQEAIAARCAREASRSSCSPATTSAPPRRSAACSASTA